MRRRGHSRRVRNRLQKPLSPRHALAIIGRLIRRRIEKSVIYNKGVSLVHNLHLGWRDKAREFHPSKDSNSEDGDTMKDHSHVTSVDVKQKGASSSSTSSSMGPPRAAKKSHQLTPSRSGESLEHHGIDTNINAIRHEPPNGFSRSKAKRERNKRKSVKCRGLVARSIGKPNQNMSLRSRRAPTPRPRQKNKRLKKLNLLRRRLDKLKDDVQLISSSLTEELEGPPFPETTTRKNDTVDQVSAAEPRKRSLESIASPPFADAEKNRKEQRLIKRKKQRTRRNTLDLINMFEAGPSHEGTDDNKDNSKYHMRTKRDRRPRGIFSKSVSKLSASSFSHVHAYGSAENLDWPSLPASGRPKGLVKETAKEIVKNKQSKSITRLTRRRWADIVALRNKETTRLDKKESTTGAEKNVFSPKTWASVASSSLRHDQREATSFSATTDSVVNSSIGFRMKRKSETTFSNFNKQMADWGKGKGKSESQKCTWKQMPDSFEKCLMMESVKAKTKKYQQQINVQSDSDNIQSLDHEQSSPSEQGGTSSSEVKSNEMKQDGPSNWCIDNMSVVYTRPVANVISLNAPMEVRTKQLNRCNNRTVTPSKTREFLNILDSEKLGENSSDPTTGMDLCDRLSMISFQSSRETNTKETAGPSRFKTRGSDSPRRKTSKHKRLGNSNKQKEMSKSGHDEADLKSRKKISLKYRALLRGENGRLDAKTVTEMATRSKKTDSLQEDKLANRNLQRRQRQRRQRTSHNQQRSPAVAMERHATRSADVMPWCVLGLAPAPKRNVVSSSAKANGPSISKQNTDEKDKSENSWDNNAQNILTPDAQQSIQMALTPLALKRPVSAQSAPELTECSNRICLQLHTIGKESIDIVWWHAYLHQSPETMYQSTGEPSTSGAL